MPSVHTEHCSYYYHVGAMSESDFDAVFDYVISDGYVQKAIRNVSEIQ